MLSAAWATHSSQLQYSYHRTLSMLHELFHSRNGSTATMLALLVCYLQDWECVHCADLPQQLLLVRKPASLVTAGLQGGPSSNLVYLVDLPCKAMDADCSKHNSKPQHWAFSSGPASISFLCCHGCILVCALQRADSPEEHTSACSCNIILLYTSTE